MIFFVSAASIAMAHGASSSVTSAPLLLTAGDGPWQWKRTRYELLDGGLDPATTIFSASSIKRLGSLGRLMRSQQDDVVTFDFETDEAAQPLALNLGVTYEEVGVGARVWDSSVAMLIYQRSARNQLLPVSARVLELGAGLGLPGIDMARMTGFTHVTLTDSRSPLLELAERNAALARFNALDSGKPFADVETAHLEWGSDATTSCDNSNATSGEARRCTSFDLVLGCDICCACPGSEAFSGAPSCQATSIPHPPTSIPQSPNPSRRRIRECGAARCTRRELGRTAHLPHLARRPPLIPGAAAAASGL